MRTQFSPRLLVTALALSLGLAANAYAMPRGGHPGPGTGMPGQHEMYHTRAMDRLHGELKLDEKQEALWKEADKFSRDNRTAVRDRMLKQRDEIKSMLDQPGADLRAVAKRMDDLKAEGQKQMTEVRERWLTVYDSLNAEQKDKVRLFFKSGMERTPRHGKGGPGRPLPPKTPQEQPVPAR